MVTLRDEIMEIVAKQNTMSIADDVELGKKQFQGKLEDYLIARKKRYDYFLSEVPNIIKTAINPKNVNVAIRIPLKLFYNQRYYNGPLYKIEKSISSGSGIPQLVLYVEPLKEHYYNYKTNQKDSTKIKEVQDNLKKFFDEYVNKASKLREEFEQDLKDKIFEELDRSGLKYSVKSAKNNKNNKWILLAIDKTKEDKVNEDYKVIYNELMDSFYR